MKSKLSLDKKTTSKHELRYVKLVFKSYDKEGLDAYIKNIFLILRKKSLYEIKSSIVNLPNKEEDITLLKSPHVYKKAKDHYWTKQFTTLLVIPSFSITTVQYIFSNLPKSIELSLKYRQ